MRTIRTILVIAIIGAISLWSNAALAEKALSIGPQVGISKASGSDAKFLVGSAVRLKFLPALAVEGSLNYRQEDIAGDTATLRSWPVQVTGLLYPLPVAYAAIGAGWYNTTLDYDDSVTFNDDTQQEFGWHFGGGLEVPLGSVAKLTGDLRYVFLDYNWETVPGQGDVKDDFYMVTTGVLFNL